MQPANSSITISASEIADLLGIKLATFMRKRAELHAAGFPRPLPTASLSPVWSRRLVTAWIDTNGGDAPAAEAGHVAAARATLEARIGEALA